MVAHVWCHYAQVKHEKYISKQVQVCFVYWYPADVCVVPVKVYYVLVARRGVRGASKSVLNMCVRW